MYVDVCKHKHLERARTRTAKLAAHRDVQSKKHWQFLHKKKVPLALGLYILYICVCYEGNENMNLISQAIRTVALALPEKVLPANYRPIGLKPNLQLHMVLSCFLLKALLSFGRIHQTLQILYDIFVFQAFLAQ